MGVTSDGPAAAWTWVGYPDTRPARTADRARLVTARTVPGHDPHAPRHRTATAAAALLAAAAGGCGNGDQVGATPTGGATLAQSTATSPAPPPDGGTYGNADHIVTALRAAASTAPATKAGPSAAAADRCEASSTGSSRWLSWVFGRGQQGQRQSAAVA